MSCSEKSAVQTAAIPSSGVSDHRRASVDIVWPPFHMKSTCQRERMPSDQSKWLGFFFAAICSCAFGCWAASSRAKRSGWARCILSPLPCTAYGWRCWSSGARACLASLNGLVRKFHSGVGWAGKICQIRGPAPGSRWGRDCDTTVLLYSTTL